MRCRSATRARKRHNTECRKKADQYRTERKEKVTPNTSQHERTSKTGRRNADLPAPEAVIESLATLSPQEFAFRHQESRIVQLEHEIQSCMLAEMQAKKNIRTIRNKNVELCRSIRSLKVSCKLEQMQHVEKLKLAEAAFRDQMLLDQAKNENERSKRAQNVNTEIATLQKRLNRKTETELLQNQMRKKYRNQVLGECRRMRNEILEKERLKEESLNKAKIDNVKLLKRLKDAQIKSASFIEDIAKQHDH